MMTRIYTQATHKYTSRSELLRMRAVSPIWLVQIRWVTRYASCAPQSMTQPGTTTDTSLLALAPPIFFRVIFQTWLLFENKSIKRHVDRYAHPRTITRLLPIHAHYFRFRNSKREDIMIMIIIKSVPVRFIFVSSIFADLCNFSFVLNIHFFWLKVLLLFGDVSRDSRTQSLFWISFLMLLSW